MDVLFPRSRTEGCELVGEAEAALAGVGIFVGFIGQAALTLALAIWVLIFSKIRNIQPEHSPGTVDWEIEVKQLDSILDILMVGNDIQMTLGISYLIFVLASWNLISLYHLHLTFDIACLVGVSNAAAMVCWVFFRAKINKMKMADNNDDEQSSSSLYHSLSNSPWFSKHAHHIKVWTSGRCCASYIFISLFIILTVLLEVRLSDWNLDKEPGRCYRANLISANDDHPNTDRVYVAVTAFWLLVSMISSIAANTRRRHTVIIVASLQLPLHTYMAIALRHNNQGYFSGAETNEDAWDFGQTTAVVLLFAAVKELVFKLLEYRKFRDDVKRRGPAVMDGKLISRSGELSLGEAWPSRGGPEGLEMESLKVPTNTNHSSRF